jgi:hypothetical protein
MANAAGIHSQRGIGLRAATSFPVLISEGPHAALCHARELSASGIVVDRGRSLSEREQGKSLKLELFLPDRPGRPVRALAKTVRQVAPTQYAFKFVLIGDLDRLALMEHLDHQRLDSLHLLEEIEATG